MESQTRDLTGTTSSICLPEETRDGHLGMHEIKKCRRSKSGMMEPGAAGFQEFQLWCDLKDDARGIRSALRRGAVEIAGGVEDHVTERPPAIDSAGKVMQRSERETSG
jgi:hypothetical protein